VRVSVSRETLLGEERRLADIEEIELIGPQDQVLSHTEPYLLEVTASQLPSLGPTLPGPAVVAEARGADVQATFRDPTAGANRPLLTVRRVGEGQAAWLAVGAAALMGSRSSKAILEKVIGPPTFRATGGGDRFRVILRRSDSGMVVSVIDMQPDLPPEEAVLRMDAKAQGLKGELAATPDARLAELAAGSRWMTIRVRPDPAAVLLIQ